MSDIRRMAQALQSTGRGGDTILAHINPQEAALLDRVTDGGSINPRTGLAEFFDDTGSSYGGGAGVGSEEDTWGGDFGNDNWSGGDDHGGGGDNERSGSQGPVDPNIFATYNYGPVGGGDMYGPYGKSEYYGGGGGATEGNNFTVKTMDGSVSPWEMANKLGAGYRIEDVPFFKEMDNRGFFSTLGNHIAGIFPGVDVQARQYVGNNPNGPTVAAPNNTTWNPGRAAGDLFSFATGIPFAGELTEEIADDVVIDGDIFSGSSSDPTPFVSDDWENDRGEDQTTQFLRLAAQAQKLKPQTPKPQTPEEELAEALSGPGYTRAGQGVIYT